MIAKLIAAALLTSTTVLIVTATTASAGERWRYEFEDRQARHMELIKEGLDQGTLTKGEYSALRREQFQISRMKRQFLANGDLSWTEKQSLRYAQDAANIHIFQERNDHEKSRRSSRLAGLN